MEISIENVLTEIQIFGDSKTYRSRYTIYQGMAEGINQKMNLDFQETLKGMEEY